jgi:hypothetical protein
VRIVIDSASAEAIQAYNWPFKIGYCNGRESAWSAAEIAAAEQRHELLALVDVLGNATRHAAILDVERGDVTDPADIAAWVRERNGFRGDAAVYCSRDMLTTLINALQGEQCYLWLADPAPNGQPLMTPPPLGLPENVILLGIQYALAPNSGGNYDISIFYDDLWHPGTAVAADDMTAAAPEAGLAAPEAGLAAPEDDYPAAAAAPDPIPEVPSAQPATSGPSGTSAAPLPRVVAASALSTSPGGAPVSSSAPSPSAVPSPSQPQMSENFRSQPLASVNPLKPPNPVSLPKRVPGPPSPLPHPWISQVLGHATDVAGMLRGAGAPGAAAQLEEALDRALETARFMQSAGL